MDPAHERKAALDTLAAAAAQMVPLLNARLIPSDGISFGFALRGARDNSGVAAVSGGIKTGSGGHPVAGTCAFGTEEPVVRIILTAMKFDPVMRSGALLQFSDRALRIFEDDLFLECTLLGPALKNPGISTLDWGIASCCKEGVPDMIFRKGASAAESRIVLIGEGPTDVANNIIICSNRI